MKGAKGVLINITGGLDMTLHEVDEAANRIREEVDADANIIFGSTFDASMQCRMRVSVVSTGISALAAQQPVPNYLNLEMNRPIQTGQPALSRQAAPPVGRVAMPAAPPMAAAPAPMIEPLAPQAMPAMAPPFAPIAAAAPAAPIMQAPPVVMMQVPVAIAPAPEPEPIEAVAPVIEAPPQPMAAPQQMQPVAVAPAAPMQPVAAPHKP